MGPAFLATMAAVYSASITNGALTRSSAVWGLSPAAFRASVDLKFCSNVAYPSGPGKNTPIPPTSRRPFGLEASILYNGAPPGSVAMPRL